MEFIKKNTIIYLLSGKAKSGKNTVSKIITDYYQNKKCVSLSYSYYLKDYVKRITGWDGSEENKPRDLLQQMGIELVKNKINDQLFVNRLIEDIQIFSYFYDVIVITDARLIEEVEKPKEKFSNVITIRIDRKNKSNNLTESQKHHITETALDNYSDFDYVVDNNGTYEDLKNKIIEIIEEVSNV